MTVLRLGTRASALATTQSEWVADRLRVHGLQVELVPVRTEGDANRQPLSQIGGTGVFVSALRDALLAGRIDLAVHSLKDLPTTPEPGLALGAVPEREDPRDALVARDGLTLAALPGGARVGTGSPRRAAQLRLARPDLQVTDLRGNVGTRIEKVRTGQLDAVVLAAAGLRRLGRLEDATEVLDPAVLLPAPGQGALGVECREDDDAVLTALAPLDDLAARTAVTAERSLLSALEAGCTAPVAALAEEGADGLTLTGFADLPGGSRRASRTATPTDPPSPTDPAALGRELAAVLLDAPSTLQPAHTHTPERDS